MTTLKDDTLSFTFPEIGEKLRHLIEQHVSSTLSAIIQADRTRALKALQSSYLFCELGPKERRNAESQIIGATPDRIAAALRRKSMSILHRHHDTSIAALEIAVTGEPWTTDVRSEPQNYVVVPDQPWLDGFAVRKGVIRQFVAMPLGSGYSVEEQVTGKADSGGIPASGFSIMR